MTGIAQERLVAYATAAETFRDLRRGLKASARISADLAILRGEGRTVAAKGAHALLAGCVRRVCATSASSAEEAVEKVGALARVRTDLHGGDAQAETLLLAMIDAAVAIENGEWLSGSDGR